jgi:hypothetical protein
MCNPDALGRQKSWLPDGSLRTQLASDIRFIMMTFE